MDQTLLYQTAMEWVISTLIPILAVVLPVVLWHKSKQQSEMDKKADKTVMKSELDSIKKDIKEVKSTASEDRALFLSEVKELRTDLRLKKDKEG